MKSALWRGRGYDSERRVKRSIRETKCAGRAHFYTFQSEGQFNCGGRPIRPSAIFSASNRPPETVNVCARAPPNDIYIYIDTVLERVLEHRPTLKCICGAGLTTNFKFFPARSAWHRYTQPDPSLAEWREHGLSPLWNKVIALLTPIVPRKFRMTGLGCHFWPLCAPRLVVLCDRKTCNEVHDEVSVQIWLWLRGGGEEEKRLRNVFSYFRCFREVWIRKCGSKRIKLKENLIFSLCKCLKGEKIKIVEGQ